MTNDKICFLISAIGKSGSDQRKHSDYVFNLLKGNLSGSGYELVRADMISKSGSITQQIIEQLFEADLVVADLSSRNPNVFYELAIRHSTNKPFIQIIESKEMSLIPFDLQNQRTLEYVYTGKRDFDNKQNLNFSDYFIEFVKNCEFAPYEIKNPIVAENSSLSFLNNEDQPPERTIIDIISLLSEKLKTLIPPQSANSKSGKTKASVMPFNRTQIEVLQGIREVLDKSKNGIISCSGPLIMKSFNNFMAYTQRRFAAATVNDLNFWIQAEGKEYLDITIEHKKKYKDLELERIFIVPDDFSPSREQEEGIFINQIKKGYSIGFVYENTLKSVTDNPTKLDFGLFDDYAVSFFRTDNGRMYDIDTNKETCKKYSEYYKQLLRKCVKFGTHQDSLITSLLQYESFKKQQKW